MTTRELIRPALELASARLSVMMVLGSASPSVGSMFEDFRKKLTDEALCRAITEYVDALSRMQALAREQWSSAHEHAQSLALGFLTEETGQCLPGQLTLDGDDTPVKVTRVNSFWLTKSGWSAQVSEETSRGSTTTRTIYREHRNSPLRVLEDDF